MATGKRNKPVSSLDFDLDQQIRDLEREWHQAYEASMRARAEQQAILENPNVNMSLLGQVQEKLERTEALKARVMAKIERLEDSVPGQD
jgi:hypothetical protein